MKFFDKGQAAIVSEKLKDLKNRISVLVSLETGLDFLHSERSYDLALTTVFRSKEDLEVYMNHPDHKEVQKYIHSVREAAVAVDYEF
jgi:heme-degrading monooxygenase HmoA